MYDKIHSTYLSAATFFYVLFWLLIMSCTYNKILVDHFVINLSSLLIPIWFFIGSVIAEVYGYKKFRRVILYSLVVQGLIALILSSISVLINQSEFLNLATNGFLISIIHYMPRIIIAHLIALIFLVIINNFVIIKLKSLLDKKYFTLRGNGISLIGELTFLIVVNFIALIYVYDISTIIKIIISALVFHLIMNTCLSIPSSIIINLLKKVEQPTEKPQELDESIFDIILKSAHFEHGKIKS